MRIALSFPGIHRKGGVERVAFECARYLLSRNHEVLALAQEWEPLEHPNLTWRKIDSPLKPTFLRGKRYFAAATRALEPESFDVLNTHGCVCPVGGVHWVQSVHAAWLDRAKTMRSALSAGRIKQMLNPVHPILLKLEGIHFRERAYKKVIATTPEVVADLTRYYDVPKEDTVIIPNGFNPTEFNPTRRAERRAEQRDMLGLTDDHIAFLFVANELPRKGYGVLLKAIKQLADPRVRLIVIGRASIDSVKSWAAREGVADQVIAHGSSSDVSGMHAAADLFVLPTQYEAFALAILESLGSGLPVVTTNIPGARDAIVPNQNGLIQNDPLNPEELAALLKPILDPNKLAALSTTTPATVTQYQWPNVLERYETVLATCASAQTSAPAPLITNY